MKAYLVERLGDDAISALVYPENGGPYPLPHIVVHSPTGYEFGYGGSGPADLALSLLSDALEENEKVSREDLRQGRSRAWRHHQDFKWEFLAGSVRDERRLSFTNKQMIEWVNRREVPCTTCNGTTIIADPIEPFPCPFCDGFGTVRRDEARAST